jgi:uncharacterized protein YjbJ (UPF0337 family)
MDWDRIAGNWKQVKQRVKEKWEKLTEDDLAAIDGRRDKLEGKIRRRYGFASDHVRKEVDDWVRWQPEKPSRLPSPAFFLDKENVAKHSNRRSVSAR